jgi:upstream activation factor subunit UAF30
MEALKKEVNELKTSLGDLTATVAKLTTDNKKIAKQIKKFIKEQEPEDKPKRVNGFAKPMKMSPELCKFLGVEATVEMARTDVTKAITQYVKAHSLQNPDNKRELILDDKLKSIIQPDNDTTVTFFNLQKFMSKHYIKPEVAAIVKEVVPPSPTLVEPETPKVKRVFKKKEKA